MNDAFLGTDPAQLAVIGHVPPKDAHLVGDLFQCQSNNERLQSTDGGDDDLVAATDGEGQTMAFPSAIRAQDDVGRRIVRILVHGVGAIKFARGRKAHIVGVESANLRHSAVHLFPRDAACR